MTQETQAPGRVVQNPAITWQVYDGEAVLIDPAGAVCLVLNETASLVWDRCAAPRTEAELTEALAAAYEGDARDMAADVHAIVAAFRQRGVLKDA